MLPETYKALRSAERGQEPQIKNIPLPKLGKNEILVKMLYAPVNPFDLLTMNNYMAAGLASRPIGLEGSGVIADIGEDLNFPHQVGDFVHVLAIAPNGSITRGTWSEFMVLPSEACQKIQEGIHLEEAACHFMNPAIVHYMGVLVERGGHKAVIHNSMSSTLGRMLIRYFKSKGIKTITILNTDCSDEIKKLGGDYALYSKCPEFEARLREIAHKEEATIAFDAVSGSAPGTLLRNMPKKSICYVYCVLSGQSKVTDIDMTDLLMGKQLAGLFISDFLAEKVQKGELQAYLKELHDLLPTVFQQEILASFRFDEWKSALTYYKDNCPKGKILLKLN